jgi:hypothetical protein
VPGRERSAVVAPKVSDLAQRIDELAQDLEGFVAV